MSAIHFWLDQVALDQGHLCCKIPIVSIDQAERIRGNVKIKEVGSKGLK